ncbi:MAG: hypothetical protein HOY69_30350 [Streptomyces sp.]|nr:hypothetical protein [Streptomyces sp.]
MTSELRALLDHAERLAWLASRELRPAEYQRIARQVVDALQAGWLGQQEMQLEHAGEQARQGQR